MSINYSIKQIYKPEMTEESGDEIMKTGFKLTMALKRGLDILLSLMALAVFLIPGIIVAVCIWMEDNLVVSVSLTALYRLIVLRSLTVL